VGPLDDVGNAVLELAGGGYVVAGTWPMSTSDEQALLVKVDASGQVVWQRQLGGAGIERAHGLARAGDGFALCGVTTTGGTADMWLALTDADGTPRREVTFGRAGFEGCWTLLPDGDGLLLAGSTTSVGGGGFDIHLLRVSADGTPR
jgi:hypothetical protein